MSAAARVLHKQLSQADIERIRAEQRETNARAVRRFGKEDAFQKWAQQTLLRSHLPDVSVIEYWEGDAPAIRKGIEALDRLAVLLDYAGPSEIAKQLVRDWLDEVRMALERFV